MIFLEFTFFLIVSFFSIFTFAGLGKLLVNKNETYFFESFFIGFIVVSFILTLFHFFLKIDTFIILFIFIFGFYKSIVNFKFFFRYDLKNYYIYLLIFIVFVPIYLSQKYHEDFGYYHLPYIINLFNEKIIFGMASVNSSFIYNSIWLNLMGLFYQENNFNYLTLPSFLLYIFFIIFALRNIFHNTNYKVSNYFLIVSLFYLILKFTRISEFGTDLPATLFSLLAIFYFLKYFEISDRNTKISYFYFILGFSIFSILIKFSSIPLSILVIFIFLRDFKILKKEIFKLNFVFIYFLAFLFFIQQFIYSGCLIFPSELTCFKMPWYNEEFLKFTENLELTNKSFSSAKHEISKENYLLNLNWIPYWFNRNYLEISEHLLTMFVPLIIFLIILKNDIKNKYKDNKNLKILFIFILTGFLFWFSFSPVYRFAVPYFLSLFFVISVNFFIKKKFSKRVFVIFLLIAIVFNFSKNTFRILKKDDIYFGIEKIKNRYISLNNSNLETIKVYKPDIDNNKNGWQGRLCWDIPFLCTYNEITIKKKYGYLFVNKLNNLK